MINLILGGARSGKSGFAEKLATEFLRKSKLKESRITYIATATMGDEEMRLRIEHHQQSRPKSWSLIEEAFYLSSILEKYKSKNDILLIECMTLWLSNWLCSNDEQNWQQEKEEFIKNLSDSSANIILVSNEVGSGIVPMGNLSRDFVDQAGWLNQALMQLSDRATLVVAGCPVQLKPQMNNAEFNDED